SEIAPGAGRYEVIEKSVDWEPSRTALVICDMWDKHWCEGANRRGAVIAPRIEKLANALRDRGVLIIHAPSDTMKYYEGAPQRKLAQAAPPAKTSLDFHWNKLDPTCEGALPIDDSDGGCDDEPQCKNYIAWKREHPAITLAANDAVSDNGQEIYNLLEQRGIS